MSTEPKEPVQLCDGWWENGFGNRKKVHRAPLENPPRAAWVDSTDSIFYSSAGLHCSNEGCMENLLRFLGPLDPKACDECGKEFWPQYEPAWFCPDCHAVLNARQAKPEPPQPAVGQVWRGKLNNHHYWISGFDPDVCVWSVVAIDGPNAGGTIKVTAVCFDGLFSKSIDPSRVPFWPGQVWETRGGWKATVGTVREDGLLYIKHSTGKHLCHHSDGAFSPHLKSEGDLIKFLRWEGLPAEPKETTTTQEIKNMLIVKEISNSRLAGRGEAFKVIHQGDSKESHGVILDNQTAPDSEFWQAVYLNADGKIAPKGVNVGTVRKDQAIYVPGLQIQSPA